MTSEQEKRLAEIRARDSIELRPLISDVKFLLALVDELTVLAKERDALAARVKELEARVTEDNEVCLCGCAEHESYGEEGESCDDDSHECLRICRSAAALFANQRTRVKELEEKIKEASLLPLQQKVS